MSGPPPGDPTNGNGPPASSSWGSFFTHRFSAGASLPSLEPAFVPRTPFRLQAPSTRARPWRVARPCHGHRRAGTYRRHSPFPSCRHAWHSPLSLPSSTSTRTHCSGHAVHYIPPRTTGEHLAAIFICRCAGVGHEVRNSFQHRRAGECALAKRRKNKSRCWLDGCVALLFCCLPITRHLGTSQDAGVIPR